MNCGFLLFLTLKKSHSTDLSHHISRVSALVTGIPEREHPDTAAHLQELCWDSNESARVQTHHSCFPLTALAGFSSLGTIEYEPPSNGPNLTLAERTVHCTDLGATLLANSYNSLPPSDGGLRPSLWGTRPSQALASGLSEDSTGCWRI